MANRMVFVAIVLLEVGPLSVQAAIPDLTAYSEGSDTVSADYIVGSAITTNTPTVSDTPTACASVPTLPAGLAISIACVITGNPNGAVAVADYVITASNADGDDATPLTLKITVTNPVCTPVDGTALSSTVYPCVCGTASCNTNEKCSTTASPNTCTAANELCSAGNFNTDAKCAAADAAKPIYATDKATMSCAAATCIATDCCKVNAGSGNTTGDGNNTGSGTISMAWRHAESSFFLLAALLAIASCA